VTAASLAEIDHLVFAAPTLAQGIEHIADLTGATPRPGGKHAGMGTHNALVKLGEQLYLEIIAIDPAGEKPTRKRWFDLDDGNLMADLVDRPRLIHWVARTRDLEFTAKHAGYDPGTILPFARGEYRWRITVPDDGKRPGRGVLPTLIQWESSHPADALPESGLALAQLAASHPEPALVRRSLDRLGLSDDIRVTFDRDARLAVMLRTPRGLVAL
jgi:Glyoxalase-like domain